MAGSGVAQDVGRHTSTDIAIIGGGIMGASLAYWLTQRDPRLSVTLIERDPSYARASSALSAASIRQQFTTAVNIRISQASIAFLREAGAHLEVDGDAPDIGLREHGYLYLAAATGQATLAAAHEIQRAHGASVEMLDVAGLAARFPWLTTAGLAAASLGTSGEGWFDGYALLTAMLRKARAQGARLMRGEAVRLAITGKRIDAVELVDGHRLACGCVVNAAGPWARGVAGLAGIDLPVRARARTVYVISCPTPLAHFPLLIDPSGFWIRPEGSRYIAGLPPRVDVDDGPLEPNYEDFESRLWPALAHRVQAFEEARLERAWAGYYEVNVFDHNGIVGLAPGLENLYLMNGFSGHGLQQAPIVGRAVAELILDGRYGALDLGELRFERIMANEPLRELNVIG